MKKSLPDFMMNEKYIFNITQIQKDFFDNLLEKLN